jgi:hypothetical protein
MPIATKENTLDVTPAELRELANSLENSVHTTEDVSIWFNDKILFKYRKILDVEERTPDTTLNIEGMLNAFNKKWYPVVVNKLNNLTQILYDCPCNSKDNAFSFSETSIYSGAIDAI